MGNAVGSAEISPGRDIKETTITSPECTAPQKQTAGPKLPMPPEKELEERFSAALNTMNLPPDKVQILSQYDNEKKWDLICDQERFQVKNPPSTYLEKLKSCLDQGGVSRKLKRRIQELTQVLRELEISLRTNHIGWAQEFLNEENQGLNVLVNYLSVAQSAVTSETETSDNGTVPSDKGKAADRSMEDLSRSPSNPPTEGAKLSKAFTIKRGQRGSQVMGQRDDIHLCIMCVRAIMNYQLGFNLVMTHPCCVNEITLSLNDKNPRTKALVLELLAAVCLVRGGHDIILSAFDNFKEVCGEKRRFEKLMEYFRKGDSNIDFMVACMQFINIMVHSVENMNLRVYLQYEFTQHGLDDYLEQLKFTESDRLLVQIQAYLDNVFDVAALLDDAQNKNSLLEHIEQLQEDITQLRSKLEETEREEMQKVSELEKKLIQTGKEVEPLKQPDQATDGCGSSEELKELELRVRALVEQGLLRQERSPSGHLVLEVVQQGAQRDTVKDQVDAASTCSESPTPVNFQPPPPPPLPPPPPGGAVAQQIVGDSGEFTGTKGWSQLKAALFQWWGLPVQAGKVYSMYLPVCTSMEIKQAVDLKVFFISPTDKQKQPIQTKYRLPLLNWDALKSDQVEGTIFSELDDQRVLQELDMEAFEEQFKTKAQSPPVDLSTLTKKMARKTPSKVCLMEPNRAKNLAITLHKECVAASDICNAIETYNQQALSLDFLELLERFIPTEHEMRLIQTYESEGRSLDELSEEDRFMVRFGKIPRLSQRISTLTFMGNFPETVQNIRPQLNAIIAASMSLRSSVKLKKILEIILAFGNYMNSSKRGPAYGFHLHSLDLLLDTKSTDRRQTLLHFIVRIIQEKYPELQNFYTELHFLDKAAPVSFDSILKNLQAMERGMELTRSEFSAEENPVLKTFLTTSVQQLDSLTADGKTAQDAYESVVEYFGEDPKMTPPSEFFPIFNRFVKAYKQAEQDNKRREKQQIPTSDDQSAPPKPEAPGNKVYVMCRPPHMDLIAELKRKQGSPLMREGKDGAIEDIITDLRNQPYRRTDGARHSSKWKPGQQLQVSSDISL
ncbi:formin-like protein 1 [Fundulus heteroclitus]|uniref:formin-like protein 1 n=1 Tax=Fundulus heteroclitus TaxID=8078 RepID=UPI00165CE582|nr:formin-like protein 1 [Fundulus heteroclitus]